MQLASLPVDFGCDVTCQACRKKVLYIVTSFNFQQVLYTYIYNEKIHDFFFYRKTSLYLQHVL